MSRKIKEGIMKEAVLYPPENAIQTRSAFFWLDENGFVIIFNKPTGKHDINHARDNIKVSAQLTKDARRPMLIDMTAIKSMSREAREEYASTGSELAKALALVSTSVTSRIVANFFIGFNKPPVPTKIFNDVRSAKKWLMKYK